MKFELCKEIKFNIRSMEKQIDIGEEDDEFGEY